MGDGTKARGSREYIRKAVEGSLQRLRTDVIDLYQYHTPDGITPFEETFGALDELVREGKVRYVGHSNLEAAQVEEIDAFCREHGLRAAGERAEPVLVAAPRGGGRVATDVRAPGDRRAPVLPARERTAHREVQPRRADRPEGTRLSGRDEVFTDETFDRLEALEEFAQARGVTLLNVAIGGLARTTGDRVGHRRRDEARAGPRERGSSRMAADAGRPGGAQRPPLARHVPTGAVLGQTPRPVPLAKAPANGTFILAWRIGLGVSKRGRMCVASRTLGRIGRDDDELEQSTRCPLRSSTSAGSTGSRRFARSAAQASAFSPSTTVRARSVSARATPNRS